MAAINQHLFKAVFVMCNDCSWTGSGKNLHPKWKDGWLVGRSCPDCLGYDLIDLG